MGGGGGGGRGLNKAGDFRTPILCLSVDNNKIEAAHAEIAQAPLAPNKEIF